jgi:His-Xaa-Ser system protein HxsD
MVSKGVMSMKERVEELSDGTLRLSVDKALYDSETVLKTAHKFTDQCYIKLDVYDDELMISFKSKEGNNAILGSIVDDFLNELIDQQVRAMVQRECGQIRDQIVKKAFSPIE